MQVTDTEVLEKRKLAVGVGVGVGGVGWLLPGGVGRVLFLRALPRPTTCPRLPCLRPPS